jgi:hypothetical protein
MVVVVENKQHAYDSNTADRASCDPTKLTIRPATDCIRLEDVDNISGSVGRSKMSCIRSVYLRIEEDVGYDLHGTTRIRQCSMSPLLGKQECFLKRTLQVLAQLAGILDAGRSLPKL